MSPRFESISSHIHILEQSHKKTRQPCRNEPNGSATALANQDHRPCGQATTTVIQFSLAPFFSRRKATVATIGSILLRSISTAQQRERQKYSVENGLPFDPIVRLRWDLGQNKSLIIPTRQCDMCLSSKDVK
eukprot:scaffold39906_cov57-Attheya_sp.AAC.6